MMPAEDAPTVAGRILDALVCGGARCPCQSSARHGHGLTHCPSHADSSPSFDVSVKDGKLLVHCWAGCPQDDVLADLRARGLWPGRSEPTRGTWTVAKAAKVAKAVARNTSPPACVTSLWRQTTPIAGTLAARYLAARGLVGPYPSALRYLARCEHTETGQWLPALVAAVTISLGGEVVALHRTYLALDGSGKADVTPVKKALGRIRGGGVRLAEPGLVLVIGEGVETCLSVQQATGLPCWAVLGASNMSNLVLPQPPLAGTVIIAADRDPAGVQAAYAAAQCWQTEGRRVRVMLPPPDQDFNDVLLDGAA